MSQRFRYNDAPASPWKFSQVFGERTTQAEIAEADIISAGEFDETGEYLATGDRGGRVVIFKTHEAGDLMQYVFHCEFQSHESEFDYLKSLEIQEKINQIAWLRRKHHSQLLLTTNDRTIKLWKVFDRTLTSDTGFNYENSTDNHPITSADQIRIPQSVTESVRSEAKVKRVYSNGHGYHIHSISNCRDDETFLSGDDLRINLWNCEISDQSYNIVDIKPAVMEELSEVITKVQCHPQHSHLFLYTTSKGQARLCDMRAAALCDQQAKTYVDGHLAPEGFFGEILSSIARVRFSHSGRYFATRDYMTVKVWDTHNEKRPVEVYEVQEHIRTKMVDLYESDAVFDHFDLSFSHDDNELITGSYNNQFKIIDRATRQEVMYEASHNGFSGTDHSLVPVRFVSGVTPTHRAVPPGLTYLDSIDYNQKILLPLWHPQRPVLALAAVNNLYIFRR